MSPTAPRSINSSHSHDRDRYSSYSGGSIASSGYDDLDSLQSIPVGNLDNSLSKGGISFSNNKALAFSKKHRIVSSSSAPKRSLDPTIRHLDRKSPNMFKPLLSSVPSTTFYTGKASSAHCSLISRNFSFTTSSNASSDHGTCIALDTGVTTISMIWPMNVRNYHIMTVMKKYLPLIRWILLMKIPFMVLSHLIVVLHLAVMRLSLEIVDTKLLYQI